MLTPKQLEKKRKEMERKLRKEGKDDDYIKSYMRGYMGCFTRKKD